MISFYGSFHLKKKKSRHSTLTLVSSVLGLITVLPFPPLPSWLSLLHSCQSLPTTPPPYPRPCHSRPPTPPPPAAPTPTHCHSRAPPPDPSPLPLLTLESLLCTAEEWLSNKVRSPRSHLKTHPQLLTQFWIKQKLSNPEPALPCQLHSPLIHCVCILFWSSELLNSRA